MQEERGKRKERAETPVYVSDISDVTRLLMDLSSFLFSLSSAFLFPQT
jgi:hypothetical protein